MAKDVTQFSISFNLKTISTKNSNKSSMISTKIEANCIHRISIGPIYVNLTGYVYLNHIIKLNETTS